MQPKLFISILIFMGSYLPLSLILLAQDFRYELVGSSLCFWTFGGTSSCELPLKNPFFSIPILVLCSIGFLFTYLSLHRTDSNKAISITESKSISTELMSYTLPYVVSFMSLDYQETGKFIGVIIFLVWMFVITYRTGQLLMNPLLAVLGWKLFEIKYIYPAERALNKYGATKLKSGRMLSRVDISSKDDYDVFVFQDLTVNTAKNHGNT